MFLRRHFRAWPSLLVAKANFGAGNQSAFTLIELLVSCAVLILLVTVLSGSLSNFTLLASTSGKRMETDKQARAVFDPLGFDLEAAVTNGGVEIKFLKDSVATPGPGAGMNDALIFLTRARSTDINSRLAIIGYDVNSAEKWGFGHTGSTVLRHVLPFMWDGDSTSIVLSTAAEAQPLSSGVFRMELAFVLDDSAGTIVAAPPTATTPPAPPAPKIKAVICAIATIDDSSLSKLTNGERTSLLNALPDSTNGRTPMANWNLSLPNLQSLPPYVLQNIRFHERYYYLK